MKFSAFAVVGIFCFQTQAWSADCRKLAQQAISSEAREFFAPIRNNSWLINLEASYKNNRGSSHTEISRIHRSQYLELGDSAPRPPLSVGQRREPLGSTLSDVAKHLQSLVDQRLKDLDTDKARAQMLIELFKNPISLVSVKSEILLATSLPESLAQYLKTVSETDLAQTVTWLASLSDKSQTTLLDDKKTLENLILNGRVNPHLERHVLAENFLFQRLCDWFSKGGAIEKTERLIESEGPLALARLQPRIFVERFTKSSKDFESMFARHFDSSTSKLVAAIDVELAKDPNSAGPLSLLAECPGFILALGSDYQKFLADRPAIAGLISR